MFMVCLFICLPVFLLVDDVSVITKMVAIGNYSHNMFQQL